MAKRWRVSCSNCNWEELFTTEGAAALAEHDCAVIVAFPEDPWERAQAIAGLVKKQAALLKRRLPPNVLVDFEDLVSAGMVGAYQAGQKWDPEAEGAAKFTTFAQHRVVGEMLDLLRDLDTSSRNDRAKGRTWTTASMDELLHQRRPDGSPHPGAVEVMNAMQRGAPNVEAQFDDMEELRSVIHLLDDRERELVVWYFWDGVTQREIGERVGVTEARICQRLSKAMRKLRRAIYEEMAA